MTKVLVFLPSLAGGGAEKVTLALCSGLASAGFTVQLAVASARGELAGSVPPEVELIDLRSPRVLAATPRLLAVLRHERPDLVISALSHANIVAALVVKVLHRGGALLVMHHNTGSLSARRSPRRRDRLVPLLCGLFYRLADGIVAVSGGVADDLAVSSRLPRARIRVLPNPIEYDRIRALARVEVEDVAPAGGAPLVLAVGRLEEQKGFDVLLRAMARVAHPWRLLILGAGPEQAALLRLAAELQVAGRVAVPGFCANPYPWFAAADVFALSSRWEGLPTVLLEALAFRLRIVSTRCPSGPEEILTGVDGAELVPVDDVPALAAAVSRALADGRPAAEREAWRAYDAPGVIRSFSALVEGMARA